MLFLSMLLFILNNHWTATTLLMNNKVLNATTHIRKKYKHKETFQFAIYKRQREDRKYYSLWKLPLQLLLNFILINWAYN